MTDVHAELEIHNKVLEIALKLEKAMNRCKAAMAARKNVEATVIQLLLLVDSGIATLNEFPEMSTETRKLKSDLETAKTFLSLARSGTLKKA